MKNSAVLLFACMVLLFAVSVVKTEEVGAVTLTVTIGYPQCSDGSDNDTDGLVDLLDTDCTDSLDESESSTPSPPPSNGGGSSGGGGGGGGGGFLPSGTQVIFRGKAYPGSRITLLRDAQVVSEAPAGPDGNFDISLSGLSSGTYTFGVWAEDKNGIRSNTHTFTVAITGNVTNVISGIFIPPTIHIDKKEVKHGDVLTLIGQTASEANISIFFNSEKEIVKKITAGKDGGWIYKFDTSEIEKGDHTVKSRAQKENDISTFSVTQSFLVGAKNVVMDEIKKCPVMDSNKDCRVNLIDFSMLAYWYKRASPPVSVDMNKDGKIDLIDFSILAYYWTG